MFKIVDCGEEGGFWIEGPIGRMGVSFLVREDAEDYIETLEKGAEAERARVQSLYLGRLNEFHESNWKRMHQVFAPPHDLKGLALCVQEEVGELASAVLGVLGEKSRTKHLTNEDILDAVADAITYLSLVAHSAGCRDLESLLNDTFNILTSLGQGFLPPE